MHLEQPPDALCSAPACVQHGITGLKLPGIHANKCELADKRIGHDLERQRRKRLAIGRLARDRLAIVGIRSPGLAYIQRRRQVIHHSIQQRLNPFILEGGSDDHRKYLQCNGRFAQRRAQLLGFNLFAFQKLVQDFVVVFRDGFH